MRVLFILLLACITSGVAAPAWRRLAPLPDPVGVASPFAGVAGDALLVAGGANFPGKKPWEGGAKMWHDAVFVLEKPDGAWRAAGKLPRPLAYGVAVSHAGGVVCAGGSDAERHFSECFRLEWRGGELSAKPLPALPRPVANACGALLGDTLFIAGGTEKPGATNALRTFFALDLAAKNPAWRELEPCPGAARMLAVAAVAEGSFFLFSGVELSAGAEGKPVRRYLQDAWRFTPGAGWRRIADLPRAAVAAPSPATVTAEARLLVPGGDDGSQAGLPPTQHRGFSKTVLAYDARRDAWSEQGETPAPRVTAPAVAWRGATVIPSGEQRPGVRSPEVWRMGE